MQCRKAPWHVFRPPCLHAVTPFMTSLHYISQLYWIVHQLYLLLAARAHPKSIPPYRPSTSAPVLPLPGCPLPVSQTPWCSLVHVMMAGMTPSIAAPSPQGWSRIALCALGPGTAWCETRQGSASQTRWASLLPYIFSLLLWCAVLLSAMEPTFPSVDLGN